jgi:hypothetical protein
MAHSVVDRLLASPSMNRELATGGADFIRALAQAASSFRPDEQGKGPGHGALVDAVLRQPWRESEVLCVAVIEFVQELVSAVPAFVPKGIDALVLSFVPAKSAAAAEMLLPEAVLLPRVHEALRGVLRACPLGIGHLYSSIKEHLPHRRFDLHVHVGFLRPTLQLLEYCHALRPRVLHLLVERLVELDAHVAQQLRALEEARDADDTIFQVESDTTQDELYKMRLNAEKLDEMLVMLCKFISATASPSQRAAAKAAAVDAATDRTATWAAATAAALAATEEELGATQARAAQLEESLQGLCANFTNFVGATEATLGAAAAGALNLQSHVSEYFTVSFPAGAIGACPCALKEGGAAPLARSKREARRPQRRSLSRTRARARTRSHSHTRAHTNATPPPLTQA